MDLQERMDSMEIKVERDHWVLQVLQDSLDLKEKEEFKAAQDRLG